MNIAKLAVLLGAIVLASGGIGAALAESRNSSGVAPIDIEARKNENDDGGVLLFADDDDDDDDSTDGVANVGDDSTNGTGTSNGDALVDGRSAAEWMASANLYKQRWMQMKQANNRHAQQVRNLRASRAQVRQSSPRAVRAGGSGYRGGGGGTSGGGTSFSGGGDT